MLPITTRTCDHSVLRAKAAGFGDSGAERRPWLAVVALITDYGERDYNVVTLEGVLLSRAPEASLVDVTHDVSSFDISHRAFVPRQVWTWFPPDPVYLAVLNPGADRRILI